MSVEDVQKLLSEAEELTNCPIKVALLEEAVLRADEAQDETLAFSARMALVVAAQFSGMENVAIAAFAWCLAKSDRDREKFPESNLLWRYKWILGNVTSFPDVSIRQIAKMEDDLEERLLRNGYSLRPVLGLRRGNAAYLGDQERARHYYLLNFLGAFGYERRPYGYGIGTASLGIQYIAMIFHVRPPVGGVESGFGTLVIEMGIGGLILWLVMSFSIVLAAWRVVKKLKGSPWFPIAFMIFWYAGLLLFPMTFAGMQPYQDFVLNAYLWLLLGILFRLPTLTVSSQYDPVNPYANNRRLWMR